MNAVEIEIILYTLLGIFVLFLLNRYKKTEKKEAYDEYNTYLTSDLEDWRIMTSFSELKVFSKFAGELRFGPAYVYLRSEPINAFNNQL